jgi:hypothetical protein
MIKLNGNQFLGILGFIVILILLFNLCIKWKKVKKRSVEVQRRYLKEPFKKLNFWNFITSTKNIKPLSFICGLIIFVLMNSFSIKKVFHFLKKLDWNIIAENSLSGIFVGIVAGGLGYLIWKKQHNYQKRKEIYAELNPYLMRLKIYLERAIDNKEINDHCLMKINEEIAFYTIPLANKFAVYYGYTYLNDVNELINLLFKLWKKEDTGMNKWELYKYINLRYNRLTSPAF